MSEIEQIIEWLEGVIIEKPNIIITGKDGMSIAKKVLPKVAVKRGKVICINVYNEASKELEDFKDYARRNAFSENLILAEGKEDNIGDMIKDDSIDGVFISGLDSYDNVRKTILVYLPKIRNMGVLCGTVENSNFTYISNTEDELKRAVFELLTDAEFKYKAWFYRKTSSQNLVLNIINPVLKAKRIKALAEKDLNFYIFQGLDVAQRVEDPKLRISILEQLAQEYPLILNTHVLLSREYMKIGDFNNAVYVIKRALGNGTGNGELYSEMGIILKQAGDIGGAETYFRAALRLNPRIMPAWLNLLIIYMERGENEKARECLHHALSVAPPSMETLKALGKASIILKDKIAMESALNQIRMMDPEDDLALKLEKALMVSNKVLQTNLS